MPRTNSPLHGYCHSDTTHRKSDQTDRHTQITGKIESIESDVEIQEISCPDQQGLNNEKTFTLHQPDALHSIPDVLQHRLCFLDQRKVTHICEYKPNSGNKNYAGHINPYRVEHGLKTIQQRRVLRKETMEKIKIEDNDGHCDQPDHDGIAHTVDQQRPQQAGKRDLVIFGYHPATPDFTDTW